MTAEKWLLNVNEFADLLNVKPATIRRWLLLRKISSTRIGGRLVRIPRGEAARLVDAGFCPSKERGGWK
jgi:excisionase family DNA binding protein